MHYRTCKICGKDYKTVCKFGRMCDKCKEKNKNWGNRNW